jgi:hypothetical protein
MKTTTKALLILSIALLGFNGINAQVKVGDNPTTVDARSLFELESTNKALWLPRLTTTQRDGQTSWKVGMFIYNSTDSCVQMFNGTIWNCLAKGGANGSNQEPWYNVATNTAATDNTQNIYQKARVVIGSDHFQLASPFPAQFEVAHPSGNWGIVSRRITDDGGNPNIAFFKSRGDNNKPPISGDNGGRLEWLASTATNTSNHMQMGEIGLDINRMDTTNNNAATNMHFATRNLSGFGYRMLIDSNGYVGIGTTNPTEKLHIAGHTQIDSILNMGRTHLHVLDISYAGTPTVGYKIATKIPNTNFPGMYLLKFTGYAYGVGKPIDFTVVFYSYIPSTIVSTGISAAAGSWKPDTIKIANEGGFISVLIKSPVYYNSMNVDVYEGTVMNGNSYLKNWSWSDTDLSATATNIVTYNKNSFSDNNYWGTNGNAGTSSATNFIGTTDAQDVVFKRNNEFSGLISQNTTAFGDSALNAAAPLGNLTTAIGSYALSKYTGGNWNTAVGHSALRNMTTSYWNTAVGAEALSSFINSGSDNTALGAMSYKFLTAGTQNVAVGTDAGKHQTGGNNNTLVGAAAMFYATNKTTSNNTGVGKEVFSRTNGNNNTALGYGIWDTYDGDSSIFIGSRVGPRAGTSVNKQLNIGDWIYGVSGKIGIGAASTNPTNQLQVSGANATMFDAAGFYNTNAYGLGSPSETRINIGKIENGNLQSLGAISALPTTADNSTEGNLKFYSRTGSALVERMTVSNLGNVGIGTTSPIAKLHIQGTSGINRSLLFDTSEIKFKGEGLAHWSIFGASGVSSSFSINNTSVNGNIGSVGTPVITIVNGSNNVGIGTTVPTSKLQVVGLPIHANNTAALTAGLTVGAFYHAGDGIVRVVF